MKCWNGWVDDNFHWYCRTAWQCTRVRVWRWKRDVYSTWSTIRSGIPSKTCVDWRSWGCRGWQTSRRWPLSMCRTIGSFALPRRPICSVGGKVWKHGWMSCTMRWLQRYITVEIPWGRTWPATWSGRSGGATVCCRKWSEKGCWVFVESYRVRPARPTTTSRWGVRLRSKGGEGQAEDDEAGAHG